MNRTKIEWCDYTWNPVVGCRRGCPYCYAKRVNDRFKIVPDFSKPVFFPRRLHEPLKLRKPSTIFVGSMTDICYWEAWWLSWAITIAKEAPQHTFMFLTKARRGDIYSEWDWPSNCIVGRSYTEGVVMPPTYSGPRTFVSIEPLLGEIQISKSATEYMEKIIVGAMTGPGAVKPEKAWINSIRDSVPEDKIFWKNNIKRYL